MMTHKEFMALVNRYTEACDDLGAGLFMQSVAETKAKHAKAAELYGQIQAEVMRLHAELAGAKQSLMLAEFCAQNADRAAIAAATAEWRAAGVAVLSAMDEAKRLMKVAGLTMEGGTISEPYNAAAERLRVLVGA